MGKMDPVMRPTEAKKAAKEFLALGFDVDWDTTTGIMKIRQPSQTRSLDAFDLADMRRK